jgi:glutathione synthase/RimK-type ligase-like ATP-grasp enzyme
LSAKAPIVVGDRNDPHIAIVEDELVKRGRRPLVIDLETVTDSGLSIDADGCAVKVDGIWVDLNDTKSGWLRRLHRAGWGLGVETGSRNALELGTWHSAYTWMLDAARVKWITEPTPLRRSESKLRQWRTATALGIPYPRTIVTTSHEQVISTFGEKEVIVKPLGTGRFVDNGNMKTVYAEPMMPTDDRLSALKLAPFIVQERLQPIRHLRIVTVGDRSWAASLGVEPNAPADWRRRALNHSAFEEVGDVSPCVARSALGITRELGLGYSSQDWIETRAGETFLLDVNPAGQWLFLPQTIGKAVARAIADLLLEDI